MDAAGGDVVTHAETLRRAAHALRRAAAKVADCDDGCCLDPTLLRLAGEVLAADQATPLGDITDT